MRRSLVRFVLLGSLFVFGLSMSRVVDDREVSFASERAARQAPHKLTKKEKLAIGLATYRAMKTK